MTMDWTLCTSPQVVTVLDILKDTTQDIKVVFATLEAFLDKASDEEGYFLMVQIRLQLAGVVANDETFVRRLDQIANQGAQSGTYIEAMQRIFTFIEKEGKTLPVPPV